MIKMVSPHRFLILLLAVFAWNIASAQKPDKPSRENLEIIGTIKGEDKSRDGFKITILREGAPVEEITVDRNGRFKIYLDYDTEFDVVFSKTGFYQKIISFNTRNVPVDDRKFGHSQASSIELVPEMEGLTASVFERPIGKYYYDLPAEDFVFDRAYTESIKQEIDELRTELREAKEAEEREKEQLEEDYQLALEDGARSLEEKDYAMAKEHFQAASSINPEGKEAQTQLAAVDKLIEEEGATDQKYDALLADADIAVRDKKYEDAKAKFEEAQRMKPDEDYPKNKLREVNELIAAQAKLEAESRKKDEAYQKAIASADRLWNSKDYEDAKKEYQDASELKPEESHPKDRLAEIDRLLADSAKKEAEEKAKQAEYDQLIADADQAFKTKEYEKAKVAYTKASGVMESESRPKERIAEIDKILADVAAREKAEEEQEAAYNDLIAKADQSFDGEDFEAARKSYREAGDLKPDEKYPTERIKAIDDKLAELANAAKAAEEKEERYARLIAEGDKLMASKDYDKAKDQFNEAAGVKPEEAYPKEKLTEIDGLLAELAANEAAEQEQAAAEKALNDKYNDLVAQADKAFSSKDYETARSGYNEALAVKPDESHPKDRLDEITRLEAEAAELAAKEAADREREAAEKEQEAAEREKAAAEKTIQDQYDALVKEGDQALSSKDFDAARTAYNEALSVKPEETYPKDQLEEITRLEAEAAELAAKEAADRDREAAEREKEAAEREKAAAEKAIQDQYDALVKEGDQALSSKDFDVARTAYNEALSVKPEETYPKDQLDEITRLEAEAAELAAKEAADRDREAAEREKEAAEREKAAAEKAIQDQYDALVKEGDQALSSKDFDAARTAYNEALSVKPEETYPKDQLDEIARLEAEAADLAAKEAADREREAAELEKEAAEKELAQQYKDLIKQADEAFDDQNYNSAKTIYQEALGVKPGESYPTERLDEIANLEAEAAALAAKQKEKDQQYDRVVADADKAFSADEFELARSSYEEALILKPDEAYPKERLQALDDRLSEIRRASEEAEQLEQEYKDLVASGDKSMASTDYPAAKKAFEEALKIKPEETYPQEQLAKIETALTDLAKEQAKREARDREYEDLIRTADAAFADQSYDDAAASYNAALGLKPDEKHPKDRLSSIDRLKKELADQQAKNQELEAKYNDYIQSGDDALTAEQLDEALIAYRSASELKPDEVYPKERIQAVEARKAELAKMEDAAKQIEEQYESRLAAGNKALKGKNYEEAKTEFTAALDVKPDGTVAKERLEEVEQILADLAAKESATKELDERYAGQIEEADAAFAAGNYDAAEAAYKAAQQSKPAETYPNDQLDEIAKKRKEAAAALAKQQALKAQYDELIVTADKALEDKQYDQAKRTYQEAQGLIPGDEYATTQIKKIDDYFALKAKQEEEARKKEEQARMLELEYKNLISEADGHFRKGEFDEAKKKFEAALNIKDEEYPKEKLKKIEEILKLKGTTTVDPGTDEPTVEDSVTETVVEEKTKTITTRVVVRDGVSTEYKKVEHNWGGKYFFKNGESISQLVWNRETVK